MFHDEENSLQADLQNMHGDDPSAALQKQMESDDLSRNGQRLEC